MATGGQLTILSPDDYKIYYHINNSTGNNFVTREGHPIELTKDLKSYDDLSTLTPDTLWNKRQTRHKSYNHIGNPCVASITLLNPNDQTNLDFPPISPIDGNTTVIESNDKGLTQDQLTLKALHSILEILTRPNTTIATKDWAHGMLQKIMARCDNDDDTESVNSDITNDINKQLKQSDLALTKKDNEILKLKAELTKQQNSIQQTLEQTLAKQQKEFQDQMKQMTVQGQAETSALQNQFQKLNASMQQQQQYYASMFTNGPSVFPNITYPSPSVTPNESSLNISLIQELSYSLNMQTQINKQYQLNMAPSYDGKDQSNFTHGLMQLKD